jgi:hypothetical protein
MISSDFSSNRREQPAVRGVPVLLSGACLTPSFLRSIQGSGPDSAVRATAKLDGFLEARFKQNFRGKAHLERAAIAYEPAIDICGALELGLRMMRYARCVIWVATSFDWFAQASWKEKKNRTTEHGVRHSTCLPWHSRWGRLAEFLPAFYNVQSPRGSTRDKVSSRAAIPTTAWSYRVAAYQVQRETGSPYTGGFNRLYHCLPDGLTQTYYRVFRSRIGIAYALTPTTALRAGIANRIAINRDTALGGNAPFQPHTTVINRSAAAPADPIPRLFPFTLTRQDPVFKIPTAWNWNATFQRNIGWGTTVEIGNVGRRGIHNQRKRNINQLPAGRIQANPCVNLNALRPYLGLGILGIAENSGLSIYHGLQVSIERRVAQSLHFGMAYAFTGS